MKLRGDAHVRLDRNGPDLDLFHVFHALNDARFERDASRRALAALDLPPELFDLDAIARGDRIATDRLLWDVWRKRPSALELGDGTDATAFELADEDLPAAAAALLELGAARDPDAAFLAILEVATEGLARLFANVAAHDRSVAEFPAIQEPGIYRREHASLVIRSRTTTVITDPQGGTQAFTSRNYPTTPRPLAADGVLITHLHEDHWAPASILLASRGDTRVIVPQVPQPSLLTQTEPVSLLTACGVDVVALPWWQSTMIGDIRIDALPFYGEQPTRTADLLGLASSGKDAIVDDVASALAARRAATSVVRWNPGDVFSPGVGAK